jgi:putative phosphoesterase
MKIGLLSDTHSYLDPQIFHYFSDCDEIWHAGDIGNHELANRLEEFKPLRAVYGNIDDKKMQLRYPEHNRFTIDGLDVWMTHIGGYPGKYPKKIREMMLTNPPDLYISGHSHILKVMPDAQFGLLHMNPGACGIEGWHKMKTLLRFDVNNGQISNLELIELGPRAKLSE